MFNLGKKLQQKAQEVAAEMEKDGIEKAPLTQGTFDGFLVKDGIEGLQTPGDVKNLEVLGSMLSDSGVKYWLTLKS